MSQLVEASSKPENVEMKMLKMIELRINSFIKAAGEKGHSSQVFTIPIFLIVQLWPPPHPMCSCANILQ